MSYDIRFVVVACAAFAVANLVCCALVPWLWRRRSASSLVRAEELRHLRLLPAVVSLLFTSLTVVSFSLFEPRGHEPIGTVMIGLASIATAVAGGALVRLFYLMTSGHRAAHRLLAGAAPITVEGWPGQALVIDSAFPIVAIVGIWRPRLLIARSILTHCTPDELRAILAHEKAHVTRRDNLGRLLLAITPDVISWLPLSERIAAAWHDAAEESADESAEQLGARGRVLLAEALIRVAKLVPPGASPAAVPMSALYRGENIERRVRRLLSPIEPVVIRWSRRQRQLGRAMFVLACVLALKAVYGIVEAAVTFLP